MMKKNFLFALLAFYFLSACADQGLGFGKSPPNEFLILTYPPLVIPPNISLRAPSTPEESRQISETSRAAQSVYGKTSAASQKMSASEKAFAKRIGVNEAQRGIRRLIAADRGLALYPRDLISKIMRKKPAAKK